MEVNKSGTCKERMLSLIPCNIFHSKKLKLNHILKVCTIKTVKKSKGVSSMTVTKKGRHCYLVKAREGGHYTL